MSKNIVVGAGAWGTAIANLIAQNGFEICAISDNTDICQEINENHTHQALSNTKLDKNLISSLDLEKQCQDAKNIFIVVPSNVVLPVLKQLAKLNLNCGFIFCTKGLEHSSLKLFSEIFSEIFPKNNFAILSGPNFAIEVANNIPTITNIATKNAKFGQEIIEILQNNWFKPILSQNVKTAEISAIVKNIIAISCGICDGLELGENTKAALVIQGIHEIKLLAKSLGEENPNLENAAGFGDIFLTCSTAKSRNNSLGKALGQGQKYQDLAAKKTYEGAINADAIDKLATELKLKLPLCQIVNEILQSDFKVPQIKSKLINSIF